MSLTSALSHAAHPADLAPGIWPIFNGGVNAILLLPDSSFIVGGSFSSVTINGVTTGRNKLVHILANSTLDTNFPTADSTVFALASDSAGRIFIGGDFVNLYNGATPVPSIRVARLTSAYAIDAAFNTATAGPDDDVLALAPVGDGSVYVGGRFNGVGTVVSPGSYAAYRLAKLKADGSLDSGFKSGATNDVHTILRLSNGTMYVGGITNVWGLPVGIPPPNPQLSRLAKISASGARDAAFKAPDVNNISNIVYSVIQLKDGSLLVGANTGVKRLNAATGALISYSLTGHFLAFGAVAAVAQQVDGKLLSGAYGTCYLTDLGGTKDPNFNISSKFSQSIINTIKLDKNGRIFIGGNFIYTDGVNVRNRLVVLNGTDPRSQSISFPAVANPTFKAPNNVFTLNATSSSGLPVAYAVTSGMATLAGNKLTILGAGTIVVTATQAGNATFDPATPNALNIFVPLEEQTLTFAPLIDRPTGTAPFLLGAAASSGLAVTYQVLNGPASVSGNVLMLTGATGVVSLRASQPGNSDFTAAAAVDQSFDVFTGTPAKLPQTIVFNPLPGRSISEGLAFTLNASATSGLPLSFTFTGPVTSIVGNTVTLSGVTGTVAITAKQAGNANFLAAADVKQSFAVTAAATALTLTNLIQTYTGTPRAIGTVGGTGTPVISYTIGGVKGTTPPTNAGSYPVEAVIGTGPTAVKKTGSLVINKAPLIIAADDKRKFTGQDNPALTFAYSGFLGSDNALNALSKAPTVATTATKTSPGGNHPITPTGGAATNYAFVYVKGNMKVETFAGQYEALLTVVGSAAPTAKLEITVGATGLTYTGKLTTAKEATPVALTGTLPPPNYVNETVAFTKAFTRGTGAAAVTYNIIFTTPLDGDFTASATRAIGTPAGAATGFGMANDGKKLVFPTGTPPVTYAGAYTVIFSPDSTVNALPRPLGYSHATAAIDAKGKLTLAGTLADGTKITASLYPDANAGYRLYLQPYTGRLDSYCAAWFEPQEHPDFPGRGIIRASDMQGLFWAKAAKTADVNYRGGIPESVCSILLDPWLPPLAAKTPNPAITLPQRLFLNGTGDVDVLYNGLPGSLNLTGLPLLVRMDATGKVNVLVTNPVNPRAWKVTVTPATGAFTGSHTALDGTKSITVNFTGVMRQPPSTETSPELIGAGFSVVPQLTGQTDGTTSSAISFERPALPPN